MRLALRLAWAVRTPLLQRSAPAAQATWRVFTALPRPTAALHTRAPTDPPNPRQINSLISKSTRARELLDLHAKYDEAFDSIHLATCWSRLGRVNASDQSWLRSDDGAPLIALREQTKERVQEFGAQAVSTTAHAMAKLDLRGAAWGSLWKEVEGAALARRREFKPQELVNTAWAFATAGRATHALMDAAAEESAGRVRAFNAQDLTNTAWAFATAGHAAPALFDAIGKEAAGRVRELNPQNLANTAWAFATAGHAAPAFFDAIGEEAAGRVREFKSQGLSNTAWAFATAGHVAPALFDAIGKEAAGRVRELNPQELSNAAWAFATAGHAAPALFDAIGKEAAGRVRELNPQALANTAWAFAKAGHAAPALFDAIGREAAGRVRELNPQNLANTAWAFATAGHGAPALFDAIGKEAVGRVGEFLPQNLSNTAWAFAKAGHAAPVLFDAIGREATGRVHELNPQNMAKTAWAFAKAGHAAPALFDAIGEEAAGRVRDFKPQELSNAAWAFATAGHAAPALFDAIGREAAERVRELNPQGMANTAWAFAVLDHLPSESSLFDQRFAHHCDALADEFSMEGLCQLHQWRLWYASERACSDALPGAALLAHCDAAFRATEAQPSRLQRDVAKALSSLGSAVQGERVLEEGYSLDLVVECSGEELIAVEVDGPSHFVGRVPTGATLLKRRQLRHFGWRLVSVPYWEWDELHHPDQSKEREQRAAAYLSSLLAGTPAAPDSSPGDSAAAGLAVGDVRGVGPKRVEKLHAAGITRAGQLAQLSDEEAAGIATSASIPLKTLLACVLNARQLVSGG